jgi:hypothetical protein
LDLNIIAEAIFAASQLRVTDQSSAILTRLLSCLALLPWNAWNHPFAALETEVLIAALVQKITILDDRQQ